MNPELDQGQDLDASTPTVAPTDSTNVAGEHATVGASFRMEGDLEEGYYDVDYDAHPVSDWNEEDIVVEVREDGEDGESDHGDAFLGYESVAEETDALPAEADADDGQGAGSVDQMDASPDK